MQCLLQYYHPHTNKVKRAHRAASTLCTPSTHMEINLNVNLDKAAFRVECEACDLACCAHWMIMRIDIVCQHALNCDQINQVMPVTEMPDHPFVVLKEGGPVADAADVPFGSTLSASSRTCHMLDTPCNVKLPS